MPHLERPEPGTYETRLAKGGPRLPVLIDRPCRCTPGGAIEHDWSPDCDRYPRLRCLVAGEDHDVLRIWNYCRPIARAEYETLLARTLASGRRARAKVDLATERSIF